MSRIHQIPADHNQLWTFTACKISDVDNKAKRAVVSFAKVGLDSKESKGGSSPGASLSVAWVSGCKLRHVEMWGKYIFLKRPDFADLRSSKLSSILKKPPLTLSEFCHCLIFRMMHNYALKRWSRLLWTWDQPRDLAVYISCSILTICGKQMSSAIAGAPHVMSWSGAWPEAFAWSTWSERRNPWECATTFWQLQTWQTCIHTYIM